MCVVLEGRIFFFVGEEKEKELNWCSAGSVQCYCSKDKQDNTLKPSAPVVYVRSVKQLKMLSR